MLACCLGYYYSYYIIIISVGITIWFLVFFSLLLLLLYDSSYTVVQNVSVNAYYLSNLINCIYVVPTPKNHWSIFPNNQQRFNAAVRWQRKNIKSIYKKKSWSSTTFLPKDYCKIPLETKICLPSAYIYNSNTQKKKKKKGGSYPALLVKKNPRLFLIYCSE